MFFAKRVFNLLYSEKDRSIKVKMGTRIATNVLIHVSRKVYHSMLKGKRERAVMTLKYACFRRLEMT